MLELDVPQCCRTPDDYLLREDHGGDNRDPLIIVGSGSLVLDIYRFAVLAGYRIIIIDDHPETMTRDRFPLAQAVQCGDIAELLKSCEITDNTSIVIASYHHEWDEVALLAVIHSPARYIGILGNKRKVTAHFSKLNSLGIAESLIDRVFIPVGLDLGGQKTTEIALAVMAEMQAVKYQRPGGFLTIQHVKRGKVERDELF